MQDNAEWKKCYIKRCEDATFWEGADEKYKPKFDAKTDILTNCSGVF
jgi:hypothetical protein